MEQHGIVSENRRLALVVWFPLLTVVSTVLVRVEVARKGSDRSGWSDRVVDGKYDNIYGDLSAGSRANSISRDLDFGHKFLVRRQDRIMFGTDYLTPQQEIPQFALFEQKLSLSAEVAAKIHRENARRVPGLM